MSGGYLSRMIARNTEHLNAIPLLGPAIVAAGEVETEPGASTTPDFFTSAGEFVKGLFSPSPRTVTDAPEGSGGAVASVTGPGSTWLIPVLIIAALFLFRKKIAGAFK